MVVGDGSKAFGVLAARVPPHPPVKGQEQVVVPPHFPRHLRANQVSTPLIKAVVSNKSPPLAHFHSP
eukprot:2861247-Lingulodinium_polyedra.AAC.1